MLNKNLLLKVSSLLVIGLMVATPAVALAKEPKVTGDFAVYGTANTGALALPAAGMGSINLINYFGAGDQLTVDFNGIDYVVPASPDGGNGVWNHAEFSLAPGTYNWTASVMGIDSVVNGTITVQAGRVTSIGFYGNPANLNGDNGNDDKEGNADKEALTASAADKASDVNQDLDDLLFSISDMTALAH
jgi:hypothetical protein